MSFNAGIWIRNSEITNFKTTGQEHYRRHTLKTMAPLSLNVEDDKVVSAVFWNCILRMFLTYCIRTMNIG